ncbi:MULTISPECIES: EAL domain-containing protein [Burkholderiaceae]|jgi:EAL domain-containing protein (putative c-di-GMP-specific phosphodiesterase class I)|uniref:Diguanylate cyclase/phosphodiesterase (GGDEF & EAL domains) with PAS/PAC sensor(S) n=1 Tax=Caballeronia sordidicola TaxID=196367 RepID=A0A242N025_CABSO|nr:MULTISPECIES: EAL domain-containing protein [Burkholderiaceae]OTP77037.1 diguanylate cyclase/phosphodiesterase (GGDEF & EAL domains) with PAS/PAC sensor(s) [Caballeronia sordidicola]
MKIKEKEQLCQRVRRGLRAGEFAMAFQGIYQMKTGALTSAEALIRWLHPEYGTLLPDAFISAIEDPRVAADMTYFVIKSTSRQLGQWQREGRPVFPIAVNVPPSVAMSEHFTQHVERIARSNGISPGLLQLELSEAEDATRVLASKGLMAGLRDIGVTIAIDDFGTGYSSLAMLSAMDIDVVKLAKELLVEVPTCPRACAVVSAMLNLLQTLRLTVVVEGVETQSQAKWLAQWPHVLTQGFYYGRPTFGLANVPGCKRAPVRHLELVSA